MSPTELAVAARARDDEVSAGVRAMAPMIVGFAPFALLVGAAVAASDNPVAAWLGTWTIYGGAAHLAVLDVLQRDAGIVAAAVVGLVINARLTAYSAAMAPQWRSTSVRSRLVAALMLTDASWALGESRTGSPDARRRFYLGASLALWVAWPALVTLGVIVGQWFHEIPALTLLPALTLGSLAVRQLRDRPAIAAGAAAGSVAIATTSLPTGIALMLSALAGALAGVLARRHLV